MEDGRQPREDEPCEREVLERTRLDEVLWRPSSRYRRIQERLRERWVRASRSTDADEVGGGGGEGLSHAGAGAETAGDHDHRGGGG